MVFRHLAAGLLFAFPLAANAQSLDLSITDPDQIAAECGGTADAGAILFEDCRACHSVQVADADQSKGPHLQSLFGRPVGGVEEFDYSNGLRIMNAAGAIWEREALHAFLADPKAAPSHPAVGEEQSRRDILTYLRTATLAPPPAPGEMEIAEEVYAIAGDPAYGEYLSGECAGCHQSGGSTLPAIAGLDGRYFVTAMHEYRARARTNQTMQMIAARLSDEEIAALAAYFEGAD